MNGHQQTTRAAQQQHEWTSLTDTKTARAEQQQHEWTSLTQRQLRSGHKDS